MNISETEMFYNEMSILHNLNHPNILKNYEYFEDEKRYYAITEMIYGGELFELFLKDGKFSERDTAVVVKQVLSCVNYCHGKGIVHRDLKLENILIKKK